MRILGLDFGSKTVGVAVSDELMLTAQGLEIVRRQSPNKLRQTLARIERIVTEYQVERIVLGFPEEYEQYRGRALREDERVCTRCWSAAPGFLSSCGTRRLTTVAADRHMMESRNTQRESQTVCGRDCGSVYSAGISGFTRVSEDIEWSKYGEK